MKKVLSVLVLMLIFSISNAGNQGILKEGSDPDSLKAIEKVYLQTDRDIYYPGEDVWFKAYLVESTERLLTDHSYNLHVELISPGAKVIDSRMVKLGGGLGHGDFSLPSDLPSGRYLLRAYTNLMRNFGDQLFFNKTLTVINPAGKDIAIHDSADYVKNYLDVSFFPEGGSLVDDVQSVIAFKAIDAAGTSCDVSGEIFSSEGAKITESNSIHRGLGSFSMTPAPGSGYYALVRDSGGNSAKIAIPRSFARGVVLNIAEIRHNELVAVVRTNRETYSLIDGQDMHLTVSARSTVFKTISFRMSSLNSYLAVRTDDLPDGIAMITLSGPGNLPLCERLVFISNSKVTGIKITTDRRGYNQRDSVSLKIGLSDSSEVKRTAFLSLSACERNFAADPSAFPSTISSWFLLESDVRGPVEDPACYFDASDKDRLKKLDLLLMTQGWRDFTWKYDKQEYAPEHGFNISGRVRKKFADVPVRDAVVNIGLFNGLKPWIVQVPTDSSGRFSWNGIDITGNANLIASATGLKDQLQGWLLLDSFRYVPANVQLTPFTKRLVSRKKPEVIHDQVLPESQYLNQNFRTFVQYAEIKQSIQNKYRLTDTIRPGEVTITAKKDDSPESALTRAEMNIGTIFIDKTAVITPELEKYGSLEQLMTVKYNLFSLGGHLMSGQGSPLFLFDGMPVDYQQISALPVTLIERVDIVMNEIYGERGKYGVISITSRNDWGTKNIPAFHSAKVTFTGYSEPRIFYSPKHYATLESDYKPDLRTTLLWEPDITLVNKDDLELKFFNADRPSTVRITAEGITSDGIPVTGTAEYQVK